MTSSGLTQIAEGQKQPPAALRQEVGERAVLGHFRELGLFRLFGAQLLAHHVLGGDGGRSAGLSRAPTRRTRGGPCRTRPAPVGRTERGSLVVSFTDTSLPQVSSSSAAVSHTSWAVRSDAALASSTGPATSTMEVAPPAASTAIRLSSTRPRLFTTTTFAGSYLPSATACIAASMMTAAAVVGLHGRHGRAQQAPCRRASSTPAPPSGTR